MDGGLLDNIPPDKAFEEGCDKVIVVLTRPMEFRMNEPLPRCHHPLARTGRLPEERREKRTNKIGLFVNNSDK